MTDRTIVTCSRCGGARYWDDACDTCIHAWTPDPTLEDVLAGMRKERDDILDRVARVDRDISEIKRLEAEIQNSS